MAILDKKLELCDAQAITATDRSEGQIDLGAANLQVGAGTPLYLNIRTNTGFTSSSETIIIDLYTHDASMSETTGTKILEVKASTAVSASPYATAGTWVFRGIIPYEALMQFVALRFTCSATPATGKFDAWISLDAQSTYGISSEV